MRRFFIQPELLREGAVTLGGELFRHIATVLRLNSGDTVLLADGRGCEASATIVTLAKDSVCLEVAAPTKVDTASSMRITLYQGYPKGEKLDDILQKSTELGITCIVPFVAERSVGRPGAEKIDKKLQRWEKIVREAARQSERSSIPEVRYAESLRGAVRSEESSLKLLLWEKEEQLGLRAVLADAGRPASVAVIVGPEGGLTGAEAAIAVAAGFVPVTLGSRILRTETAGPAIVAILQYAWGDIG